jgi:hypothetical protein
MTLNISTEKVATRIYVTGNTYAVKDRLKAAGCHWDGERRQWWIGTAKADKISGIVGKLDGQDVPTEEREVTVLGKARYKDRSYYVRWFGRCKSGADKFRLTTLDAKIDFWADASACEWEKKYQEARALAGIRKYVEDLKSGAVKPDEYRTDDYRITGDGTHLVKVNGSRGDYWREADARDEFDEFDN